MEQVINYVKPELLVVAIALYFIGIGIKKSEVKDKFIPWILGAVGIVLSALYVFATSTISNSQDIAMAIFTAVVQGILVAGLSNYVNQLYKQTKSED